MITFSRMENVDMSEMKNECNELASVNGSVQFNWQLRAVFVAQGQRRPSGMWHAISNSTRTEFATYDEANAVAKEYAECEDLGWTCFRVVERSDIVKIVYPRPQNVKGDL